jgi:membrane peptidoglycan carboxypeptidase
MSAQKSKPSGLLGAFAGLVGVSAVAGILVTAMVAPALAVTSMTVNTSIGVFDSIPDYIELTTLPQRNTLYGMKGGVPTPFAQVFNQNREEVSWSNVSPFVKDAVVAAEDRRFYEHGGVDLASLARATQGFVSSGGEAASGGGSTLAMQLVKNIRVVQALNLPTEQERTAAYKAAIEASPDRKLKEMKLAIGLEKRYTKNEILLAYLNIAGFGGTTYGIESAAQQYYSVSAKDLTLVQAASLIGIVQQPNVRNLNDPKKYPANKARRDLILNNMLELGSINQQQHDDAVNTPVEPKLSTPNNGCLNASEAQFFCDYVIANVENFPQLGATPTERRANWNRGGYELYTTIDLDQQAVAQAQIDANVPGTDTRYEIGAALNAVEAGTGRILTMAQNKKFNNTLDGGDATTTSVNYNTDKAYGGSGGFQTGSTYKIFTLVDWLQNGHGVNEVVNGNAVRRSSAPASCRPGGVWKVSGPPVILRNDGGINPGPVSVRRATAQSINNAFFDMALKMDLCEIRDVAESMGVHTAKGEELNTTLSSVLGTNELAPLTMSAAIATIASGGTYCEPIVLDKVVGPDGKELPGQNANCRAALSADVAAAAAYALSGPTGGYPGWTTGSAANPRDGHALIGKTGTTDNRENSWMLASTSKVSMVVWVGNIKGHQDLGRVNVAGGNANSVKFRIFKNTMASINTVYGGDAKFPDAPDVLVNGVTQPVPDVTGQTVEQATSLLESLGLRANVGDPQPSAVEAGKVAQTNPGAGARVSKGYSVTLHPSDGTLAATMPDVTKKSPAEAMAILQASGFTSTPSVIWKKIDKPTPGLICQVLTSDPRSNAATTKDVAITLTVSSIEDGTEPPGCVP